MNSPSLINRYFKKHRWELPKHAYIWLVLLFAFFPLYMILNISLKNNEQFFNAPLIPMSPYHWSNWIVGWKQISGSVYPIVS